MAFEIRYPNGEVIPLSVLNKEVMDFWENWERHKKTTLAIPKIEGEQYDYDWLNIFETGINNLEITNKQLVRLSPSWSNLKESLFHQQFGEEWQGNFNEIRETMIGSWDYMKPYIDLIEHWKSKDYHLVKFRD